VTTRKRIDIVERLRNARPYGADGHQMLIDDAIWEIEWLRAALARTRDKK